MPIKPWSEWLENREVLQQRNDADDDNDQLHDLPHPPVERQPLYKIQNENDYEKRDQNADNDAGSHESLSNGSKSHGINSRITGRVPLVPRFRAWLNSAHRRWPWNHVLAYGLLWIDMQVCGDNRSI
jgi:hypothetical protein